jgi:hypothetical protein
LGRTAWDRFGHEPLLSICSVHILEPLGIGDPAGTAVAGRIDKSPVDLVAHPTLFLLFLQDSSDHPLVPKKLEIVGWLCGRSSSLPGNPYPTAEFVSFLLFDFVSCVPECLQNFPAVIGDRRNIKYINNVHEIAAQDHIDLVGFHHQGWSATECNCFCHRIASGLDLPSTRQQKRWWFFFIGTKRQAFFNTADCRLVFHRLGKPCIVARIGAIISDSFAVVLGISFRWILVQVGWMVLLLRNVVFPRQIIDYSACPCGYR